MLALLILFATGSAASAAPKCFSREQARSQHPGAYLYWHYGERKQKCWSVNRGGARSMKLKRQRFFHVEEVKWDEFNRIDALAPNEPRLYDVIRLPADPFAERFQ